MTSQSDELDGHLITKEERKKIESDPVLKVKDVIK